MPIAGKLIIETTYIFITATCYAFISFFENERPESVITTSLMEPTSRVLDFKFPTLQFHFIIELGWYLKSFVYVLRYEFDVQFLIKLLYLF